jgi:nicotinamide mononucleotide transporter
MLSELMDQLMLSSFWELGALLLALAYLVLAAHQRQGCWLAAAVSCCVYASIFWDAKLYMESLLQVIYVIMAGYGWWQWRQQGTAIEENQRGHHYSFKWHFKQWVWVSVVAVVTALLLQNYTDADAVWLDTFTTAFSLLATYLVTKKAMETWWYWLVIDSVYVYLYLSKGFVATAMLFVLYLVLVVYAMYRWRVDDGPAVQTT